MGGTPEGPYGLPPSGQPIPLQPGDFTSASWPRRVLFDNCEIDPPGQYYVDLDDTWVLGCVANFAGASIVANVRLLRPTRGISPVQLQLAAPTANTIATMTQAESEGFVIAANIMPAAAIALGQYIYAWLSLRRGGAGVTNLYQTVAAGYLLNNFGLSWPSEQPQSPTFGEGTLHSIGVGNPAPGSDWAYTVPALTRVRLLSLAATLTSSSTAATRTAHLIMNDGANTLYEAAASTTQLLSLAYNYIGANTGYANATDATFVQWPLYGKVLLGAGHRILSSTSSIQSGDQWSAIRLLVQEYADLI